MNKKVKEALVVASLSTALAGCNDGGSSGSTSQVPEVQNSPPVIQVKIENEGSLKTLDVDGNSYFRDISGNMVFSVNSQDDNDSYAHLDTKVFLDIYNSKNQDYSSLEISPNLEGNYDIDVRSLGGLEATLRVSSCDLDGACTEKSFGPGFIHKNTAPTYVSGLDNVEMELGESTSFSAQFEDAEGDDFSVNYSQDNPFIPETIGVYKLESTATDVYGASSTSPEYAVTVGEANTPAELTVTDVSCEEGEEVVMSDYTSANDNSGIESIMYSSNSSFNCPSPGTYYESASLIANDGDTASDNYSVTSSEANTPAELSVGNVSCRPNSSVFMSNYTTASDNSGIENILYSSNSSFNCPSPGSYSHSADLIANDGDTATDAYLVNSSCDSGEAWNGSSCYTPSSGGSSGTDDGGSSGSGDGSNDNSG